MQSRQKYTQRHYAVGGTFRPSYGAPLVISAKFKGVTRSVPGDSMGFASVREKPQSCHASQALLFFWCVVVRMVNVSARIYSGSATRLPSFRVAVGL